MYNLASISTPPPFIVISFYAYDPSLSIHALSPIYP